MNTTELKHLCETAGRVLTGKNVTIRLKPPITKQFSGEVYYSPGEGFVINVDPALSDENFLYVLTHELGHVKMNHYSDVDPQLEPGHLQLTPIGELSRKVKPETIERERSAEELGSSWLKYAQEHSREYSGFTKLEQQLRCLCGYVSPSLLQRTGKVAWTAGLKQVEQTELEEWKKRQLQLTRKEGDQ